jgi:hypothetical protein
MIGWYPGWQLVLAWLMLIFLGAVIYFYPMARLLDSFAE